MVDRLLADGHSVLGVDNLVTGSLRNLEHLANEPRFEYRDQDISLPFESGRVDMVFNMASPASPADRLNHGIATLMTGACGTRNTLEIAEKYSARFLHCSTSECYGDPTEHPQTES